MRLLLQSCKAWYVCLILSWYWPRPHKGVVQDGQAQSMVHNRLLDVYRITYPGKLKPCCSLSTGVRQVSWLEATSLQCMCLRTCWQLQQHKTEDMVCLLRSMLQIYALLTGICAKIRIRRYYLQAVIFAKPELFEELSACKAALIGTLQVC